MEAAWNGDSGIQRPGLDSAPTFWSQQATAMIRAIVSRKFSWRLLIAGTCIGSILGVIVNGWQNFPWMALPFEFFAIFLLHPLMDKDLPNLVGMDLLKSPRTYLALILFAIAQTFEFPYMKAQFHLIFGQ